MRLIPLLALCVLLPAEGGLAEKGAFEKILEINMGKGKLKLLFYLVATYISSRSFGGLHVLKLSNK